MQYRHAIEKIAFVYIPMDLEGPSRAILLVVSWVY